MPYMTVDVPAERAVPSREMGDREFGIYHSYKDDDVDNGPSTYWYVLDPYHDGDQAFDVRLLPNWQDIPDGGFHGRYKWVIGILIEALALDLFTPDKYAEWSGDEWPL